MESTMNNFLWWGTMYFQVSFVILIVTAVIQVVSLILAAVVSKR